MLNHDELRALYKKCTAMPVGHPIGSLEQLSTLCLQKIERTLEAGMRSCTVLLWTHKSRHVPDHVETVWSLDSVSAVADGLEAAGFTVEPHSLSSKHGVYTYIINISW